MSRQANIAYWLAGISLVLLLIGFGLALNDSQHEARTDLEERFSERPAVSAAFTEALFGTTAGEDQQRELLEQFGGEEVTDAAMTKATEEDGNVFSALLDDQGTILAISDGAPPMARADLMSEPEYVTGVLAGDAPYSLSDVQDFGPGAEGVVLFSQPIETAFGERVLVNGFPPELLNLFLGGYLREVPIVSGGESYLLDSVGGVIASSDQDEAAGGTVGAKGLVEAIDGGESGTFGDGQYFAASPVENSTWRVVATASEDVLFEPVSGWSRLTPWLILIALTLLGVAAMILLRRVLRSGAKLADANAQLEANSIELEGRTKELERSNAELDQFALIASHDLQEPLRKVQMFSQKVIDTDASSLSEKGQDYLRRSADAAARMQVLIQDLLALSRISTQHEPFEECRLAEPAREAVADLEQPISSAGGRVEIGSLPTVTADQAQMRQLFQNLISNAIKFRREGVPPVVTIDGEVRGGLAEVQVSDNGIGFESGHANRIFRVFERLHGRSEYPGTGIGLALCRKIAERHGGSISALGTPGEGATFTIVLPIARTDGRPDGVRRASTTEEEVHVRG